MRRLRIADCGLRIGIPRRGLGTPHGVSARERRFRTALGLCASLVLFSGCQSAGPKLRDPIRAIWVTRFDYKSKDDVVRIMDNCKGAGFNTILFQVRGNGTAFYDSTLEPWADELGGRHPGWDPLDEAIRAAHQRDMQLHAWVNVMPAWRGPELPKNPKQIYHKRPDWFWYDKEGHREPLVHQVGDQKRGWYVSLNPCLPDVREYLVEVFRELARGYPIDGLHMDYIRFPNEPVVSGEQRPDYPRDPRTLALYREDTGLAPDDDPARWSAWRTQQVNTLVADIRAMLRATRPQAALTAAVGSVRENGLKHFQDGRQWMTSCNVDAIFLMNYTYELDKFVARNQPWLAANFGKPVVPGLWFDEKRPVLENTSVVRQQIEAAMESAGHFCVFAYANLFDSGDTTLARGGNEGARRRETRRRELLPFLQSLAAR